MKQFYLLLFFVFSIHLLAKTKPINVVDLNFKIPALSSHQLAYGFAAGDKIIISYSEDRGKKLKNFEVKEYKASKLYSEFNVKVIDKKEVTIKKSGIYIFNFENTSLGRRICNFKIDRIPASEETETFNTTVKERTITDTVYTVRQEHYVKSEFYKVKPVHSNQHFYVNSGSNAMFKGGKSRVILPFVLPKNTVKWYYSVSSFRENYLVENTSNQIDLASDLTRLIDQTGGISFLINQLGNPPGANYCDVYLLDYDNLSSFLEKEGFSYLPEGTRENIISANIEVQGSLLQQMYIGIKNPDATYGINVLVSIVAVVIEQEIGTRDVKESHVNYTKELYLEY